MKLQPYVGNFRVSGQGCQAWLPRLLFSSWLQDLRSRNYILEQPFCTPRRNASWPTGGDKPKCVYTLTTRVKTDHFGVKAGHLEPRIRHMNQTTGCLADTPNHWQSDKWIRQIYQTTRCLADDSQTTFFVWFGFRMFWVSADPRKHPFWDFAIWGPESPETPVNGSSGRKARDSENEQIQAPSLVDFWSWKCLFY